MSLISRPRHTVQVVRSHAVQDETGSYTDIGREVITVPCNVHPTVATEAEEYGPILTDSYTLTVPAGKWPGDERCQVVWEGDTYYQVGRVLKSRMGVRTKHDRVVIQRGNPDA